MIANAMIRMRHCEQEEGRHGRSMIASRMTEISGEVIGNARAGSGAVKLSAKIVLGNGDAVDL